MDEQLEKMTARNADQARMAEDSEAALERWRQEDALRKKAAARRADNAFGARSVLCCVLLFGLLTAVDAGLVAPVLAGGLLLLGFAYIGFHAGAWWQYRFGGRRRSEWY